MSVGLIGEFQGRKKGMDCVAHAMLSRGDSGGAGPGPQGAGAAVSPPRHWPLLCLPEGGGGVEPARGQL